MVFVFDSFRVCAFPFLSLGSLRGQCLRVQILCECKFTWNFLRVLSSFRRGSSIVFSRSVRPGDVVCIGDSCLQ